MIGYAVMIVLLKERQRSGSIGLGVKRKLLVLSGSVFFVFGTQLMGRWTKTAKQRMFIVTGWLLTRFSAYG